MPASRAVDDRSRTPRPRGSVEKLGFDLPPDVEQVKLTSRPRPNELFLKELIMMKEFTTLKWGDVPYAEIFHVMLKNTHAVDAWKESNLAEECGQELRLIPANYCTIYRPILSMPKLIR